MSVLPQYHKNIIEILRNGHYIYVHEDAIHKKKKCEIRNKNTNSLIRTIHIKTFENLLNMIEFIEMNGRYYLNNIQLSLIEE